MTSLVRLDRHHLCVPPKQASREAAADDLGKGGDVGADVVVLLRAASGDAEAGHHLIEDQQHAILLGDAAHLLQVAIASAG